MNGFALVFNFMNVPSNVNLSTPAALPLLIVRICWARHKYLRGDLNSSRQHHYHTRQGPLKNLAMAL